MAKANRYTFPDLFFACTVEDGGLLPSNATYDALPPKPWGSEWPQKKAGTGWDMVDDHRARRVEDGFAPDLVQEATEYWLPPPYGDDAYDSSARQMADIGPLPLGAVLSPPRQTLEECKALKRQAFTTTFASIEERAKRPQSAVLTALIDAAPVPEPDADYIWQLEDIKATNRDLLHQLEACTDWETAQQIAPWLPPVQGLGQGSRPASRPHSSATQHLYGTDNVHLPA